MAKKHAAIQPATASARRSENCFAAVWSCHVEGMAVVANRSVRCVSPRDVDGFGKKSRHCQAASRASASTLAAWSRTRRAFQRADSEAGNWSPKNAANSDRSSSDKDCVDSFISSRNDFLWQGHSCFMNEHHNAGSSFVIGRTLWLAVHSLHFDADGLKFGLRATTSAVAGRNCPFCWAISTRSVSVERSAIDCWGLAG